MLFTAEERKRIATGPRLQGALVYAAMIVGAAAFPRLAYRLRWPTRLGPRGLVAYVAFNTALGFAVRNWVLPHIKQLSADVTQAEEELTRRLGREPTPDEIDDQLELVRARARADCDSGSLPSGEVERRNRAHAQGRRVERTR